LQAYPSAPVDLSRVPDWLLTVMLALLDAASLSAINRTSKRMHGLARAVNAMHQRAVARRRQLQLQLLQSGNVDKGPRALFKGAKQSLDWLRSASQVSDFWEIFVATIPAMPAAEVGANASGNIGFEVCASMDLQKTTWRADGPQHLFITPMVDFFVRVGAPEAEIERLNTFGALVRPPRIGFWIDVSSKGGLDGGWFFPFDNMPLSTVLQACEPGKCLQQLRDWAVQHFGSAEVSCYYVGRDMGMEPPRQTEIRIMLPGRSLKRKLKVALDAYSKFGFSPPPNDIYELLSSSYHYSSAEPKLALAVSLASDDNFVRLSIVQFAPTATCFQLLAHNLTPERYGALIRLEAALGAQMPRIEYHYLKEQYGYHVYPEGFGITTALVLAKETAPPS